MTSRRLLAPVLAGLLVAGLLGVGGGGVVAAEPRTVTASITIPPAAFIPGSTDFDYLNSGSDLRLFVNTFDSVFLAPLSFPVPVVSIKRITLYADDSNPGARVCADLYRPRPSDGLFDDFAGSLCTVDSPADPQTVYTTAISPRQVNTAFHGSYLAVVLDGPGVVFYGVKVTYSYTPAP